MAEHNAGTTGRSEERLGSSGPPSHVCRASGREAF
jgi:hypothetical protein